MQDMWEVQFNLVQFSCLKIKKIEKKSKKKNLKFKQQPIINKKALNQKTK